jgi:hypothetical protein
VRTFKKPKANKLATGPQSVKKSGRFLLPQNNKKYRLIRIKVLTYHNI